MSIFLLLILAGLILIICSAFTRVPLWIGCFLVALGVLLTAYK